MFTCAHLTTFLSLSLVAFCATSCSSSLEGQCLDNGDPTQLQVCGSGVWQIMERGQWSCRNGTMVPTQALLSTAVSVSTISSFNAAVPVDADELQRGKLDSSTTMPNDAIATYEASGLSCSARPNESSCAQTKPSPKTNVYATSNNTSATSAMTSNDGYRSVAYMGNWDIYARNFTAQDLPAEALTHVIYAFATIGSDGEVSLSDPYADIGTPGSVNSSVGKEAHLGGTMEQLFILKEKNRNLKTLLSVGGWSYGYKFANWVSSDAGLSTFARSAVQLVMSLGLDGLDIDWEYPTSQAEAERFAQLLKEIRRESRSSGSVKSEETDFVLSVACPAGPDHYRMWKISEMVEHIDFWNLMAFDYAGSWGTVAAHQANVYKSATDPASTPFSTDDAVQYYLKNGVDASRLLLGIPLYGRAFLHTQGPGQPYQGIGVQDGNGSWENGVWDYKALPRPGATTKQDDDIISSWSFDDAAQTLISYDTPHTMSLKLDYVQKLGLGGVMWWEISGDKAGNESLVDTALHFFKSDQKRRLDKSRNRLEFPLSPYTNVRNGSASRQDM